MIKKALIILSIVSSIFAATLDIDSQLKSFTLVDQFDKVNTVNNDLRTIVISFEKGTGKEVNQFLATKNPDFLAQHNAVFIANISKMPSIITTLFALPKMRDYKHKILLIDDDDNNMFLQQEEKTTIYKLKDGVVVDIFYISSPEELSKVF